MATDRSPQDADKYIVRFPDGMRDRIAEAAKAAGRSMNAEIVARLEASFTAGASSGDAWAEVARIETEYNASDAVLRSLQQQLVEAQESARAALAAGDSKAVEAHQSMADLLEPMKEKAFHVWFEIGKRLRDAKTRAMGLSPLGAPFEVAVRRVMGDQAESGRPEASGIPPSDPPPQRRMNYRRPTKP